MSFRPHGRASVSIPPRSAWAICDRCGFLFDHNTLQWQFEWVGPKLQNIRRLVCHKCIDAPQENRRTIVLPPDPVAIMNARPDTPVQAANPLSAVGANASPTLSKFGSQIGNMTGNAGVPSAFDSNRYKVSGQSAFITVSNSSYNNWVGINWAGDVSGITTPSSLEARVVMYSLASFTANAPLDRGFLGSYKATSYVVQGSPTGGNIWGEWTTVASGTTTGTPGENISGTCTGGSYQFHRIAFLGDQLSPVSLAQVQFSVADSGTVNVGGIP